MPHLTNFGLFNKNWRFFNLRIYFWTWDSPELVKCSMIDCSMQNVKAIIGP
jgi:hypothetical protein